MTQKPRCGTCKGPLVQLFLSSICEYCETKPDYTRYFLGWIAWFDAWATKPGITHYVFPTYSAADKWRQARYSAGAVVKLILSEAAFEWTPKTFAYGEWEVFLDHRFEQGPRRAFLAPPELQQLWGPK